MTEDDLIEILDETLTPRGLVPEAGEAFRAPALDVLRYDRRVVRLHWVPWLGRALSVVALVRQPVDLGSGPADLNRLIDRVARAANGRFPPWSWRRGPVLALTTLVVTPEPIGPADDAALQTALKGLPRMRAVVLGAFRLNLGQEAMAFALTRGPGDLFPEPEALADALALRFRRFVPLVEG